MAAKSKCPGCQNMQKQLREQSEEIEKLKQIVKDQQKVIDKASSDGPIIWIGQINVKFHKLIQKSSGSDHNVDPFFWPRRWFPTLKDEIIYEIRKTEMKVYQTDKNKACFFVQFSSNVTELQLQELFPTLNKTLWYKAFRSQQLLSFKMKNKIITQKGGDPKTEMCFYLQTFGQCKLGAQCPYAHSEEEIKKAKLSLEVQDIQENKEEKQLQGILSCSCPCGRGKQEKKITWKPQSDLVEVEYFEWINGERKFVSEKLKKVEKRFM